MTTEIARTEDQLLTEAYARRLHEVIGTSTVAWLERVSGVSYSAIRNYQLGQSLPGWASAARIARAAGLSLDAFLPDGFLPGLTPAPKHKPAPPARAYVTVTDDAGNQALAISIDLAPGTTLQAIERVIELMATLKRD